jgi:aerobic-type carbon monoxide dehydrogenase small subunit (CoxS/CutS family)
MELFINNQTVQVDADADTPLLWVIRDDLAMTGTKYGCGLSQCGACSVMVDGQLVRSCVTRSISWAVNILPPSRRLKATRLASAWWPPG